ncbi:MAG TPA: CAP domain-containing protein [Polyangiaceae bacterium]|nr:CAP domain-containing protein [Polyangiaceae bacterium]
MRLGVLGVLGLGCACAACAAAIPQSNGAKLGEALAFAAAAGALQVAQAAAEQHARSSAPVGHSGLAVSPHCDNDDQYACTSVSVAPPGPPPEPEMTIEDAREYVLGYVNGVRKLNGVAPIARDSTLDTFAQAGSDELAQDHLPRQHIVQHGPELGVRSAEIQGPSDGMRPGSLQDQIAEVLVEAMREGPGGSRHDMLLRPEWQKLGVGIAQESGRTYFTADFSP